jgi:prepilin-type N-terminal cleavage/methylation domain-containing protein
MDIQQGDKSMHPFCKFTLGKLALVRILLRIYPIRQGENMRHPTSRGFALIELLLVLAIIGIISTIAIPYLVGQRARAQRIGDAEANARVISMGLETLKADTGLYGPAGGRAIWVPTSSTPTLTTYTVNPVPSFNPMGNTQLTFDLNAGPLTYTIDAYQGGLGGKQLIRIDQTGAKTVFP